MLPFIIAGLTAGSVYGLAGVGLVLTYKTSGIFNFAHGALATLSAYLFYSLHTQQHMPWPAAAFLCVFVLGPVLGIVLERVARVLARRSVSTSVACTIGIVLIVQALAVITYGTTQTRVVTQFLPTHAYHIGTTAVSADRIIVFLIGILATAVLFFYFRIARMGVAMRAVVDDPDLLDIAGTSPVAVRRWAWIIGVTFASASGLLLVPFIQLDSITLTFLVVSAFGAAALGGFRSLPGTYVGGLVIGLLAAFATKYFHSGLLGGLSASLPFLVLFLVLLVSPRRRLAERAPLVIRGMKGWTAPWQIQSVSGAAILVLLLLVPNFANIHLSDWSRALALGIMFLSLGLLVRTSGQVSLCHLSFMAIGACAFSHLYVNEGWPWIVALLGAGGIAIPIGAVLSIPAIRLSGLYLALATFGFGILLQFMFYTEPYMFGSNGLGIAIAKPTFRSLGVTGSDKSYYYVVLSIAVICTAFVVAVNKSRLGRLLRGLADSPTGLATSGTSVNVTRVLVFCLSAFLAGIAGVLEAGSIGQVNGDSYQPITSLVFFVLVVITVGNVPWYALLAALGFALVPSYLTDANTSNWLQVAFGVFAVMYALTPPAAAGMPPVIANGIDRLLRRAKPLAANAAVASAASRPAPRGADMTLKVSNLRVAFGGLVAVDDVSMEAPTGRITGLIGPNGAGKTTTFNACSGLNRPSAGHISLSDTDISHWGPARRARHGLGRTFQQTELFDSLTVRENVALGLEGSFAGPNALRHLASSARVKRRVREAVEQALVQCDLVRLAGSTAGSLSTGQRRLVELARCLTGPFSILLLDEPSSGLDRAETARFGEILQAVVRERNVGILLVEHDMALVTEICDYIYVLDFGKSIYEGTPSEVMSSAIVQGAYLGQVGVVDEEIQANDVTGAVSS